MNAEELRIGNYISLQGVPVKVSLETMERILYQDMEKYAQFKGQYKPIPLTEEWLLKIGAKTSDLGFLFELKKAHQLSINPLSKSCIMSISGPFGLVTPCHLKYVHQLQNLYRDLTSEELTLK